MNRACACAHDRVAHDKHNHRPLREGAPPHAPILAHHSNTRRLSDGINRTHPYRGTRQPAKSATDPVQCRTDTTAPLERGNRHPRMVRQPRQELRRGTLTSQTRRLLQGRKQHHRLNRHDYRDDAVHRRPRIRPHGRHCFRVCSRPIRRNRDRQTPLRDQLRLRMPLRRTETAHRGSESAKRP